ncbi:hypothetical protein DVJ78_10935 [Humibacter sp. BT305]|nr:hypothetical protein DVJ78_10935 [Humibacter sp. BT305]
MRDVGRLRHDVLEFLWDVDPIGMKDKRALVRGEYDRYVDRVVSDLVNRGPFEAAQRLSARWDEEMMVTIDPDRLIPGLSAIDRQNAP